MKATALVICPGRGTYQKTELGVLTPHLTSPTLAMIDQTRHALGLPTVASLDQADRYLNAVHQKPVNNAALTYAAGLCQFAAIDRERFDVVAVTGNSMGWYTSLSCAGVWDAEFGTAAVCTMAELTAQAPGQQFIYPVMDAQWRPDPAKIALIQQVISQGAPHLWMSIQYGGYAVLAGSTEAVQAAMQALPSVDERFPLLLSGHAAFHTPLMQAAANTAMQTFASHQFKQPTLPLIDGCGRIWQAGAQDATRLHHYTLATQVCHSYDFSKALQVAVKEFAPEHLILLGPGQFLYGAVAQSLIQIGWQGLQHKEDFIARQQSATPFVLEALQCQPPHKS